MHGALVIRGVGKLRQGEYLERLRFQQLVENIYPQPAALGQKKGGHSERPPNNEMAAKGARTVQSLQLRRQNRWTKLSQQTKHSRLGTFRSFRGSNPLAGNAALRPPTMICSLLLLPPSQHQLANLLPLPLHLPSQRMAPYMAATRA